MLAEEGCTGKAAAHRRRSVDKARGAAGITGPGADWLLTLSDGAENLYLGRKNSVREK